MKIIQLNTQQICRAHGSEPGRVFEDDKIFPGNICPILYHTLYPYFLGLAYGAKFTTNEEGDVHVGCPGESGVNCMVRRRKNDGSYGVGENVKEVVFAEITEMGECPHGHAIGNIFIFPNVMKDKYACPALLNNIFPFVHMVMPSCINTSKMRCPDSKDTIYAEIE